jgi:hypothetical protein
MKILQTTRKRLNKWPSKSVINDVIVYGYGVVPVGSGKSDTFNLEWRLSFSASEKLLLQKMYYGKLIFYYLVKKAFRSILPKCEIFKSYHIKVLYFWYIEEIPDMQFYPHNYGQLMANFFDAVLLAIADRTVVHYFISSVNLIAHITNKETTDLYKLINSHRMKILQTFEQISNWSIMKTKDFSKMIGDTCCSQFHGQGLNICNGILHENLTYTAKCCAHFSNIQSLEECFISTRSVPLSFI